ncbi:hypothetical protein D1872_329180 [compost metagenome]
MIRLNGSLKARRVVPYKPLLVTSYAPVDRFDSAARLAMLGRGVYGFGLNTLIAPRPVAIAYLSSEV